MAKAQTISGAILITCSAFLAACSMDARDQPNLGSVLPIRIGVYVDESQTCADPANAGILSFDGEGLNGAHTHACHMKIESQQGKRFAYAQQCIDAGVGDGPSTTESGLLSIESERRFVMHRRSGNSAFNYCEPSALPPAMRTPQSK